MTSMKTLLYSLWLSINIIVVGLTAYHIIKLEKEINTMAIYNSTHTGQEIDNAVDKLKDVTKNDIDSIKNIKLYRHTVSLGFTSNTTHNQYLVVLEFYTIKNIEILNFTQLAQELLGDQELNKYSSLFTCKQEGNNIYYICNAFYKGNSDGKYYIDYIEDTTHIISPAIDNVLDVSDSITVM